MQRMGVTKRHWEEVEARGYSDVDGLVCSVCITEPALAAAIRAEGREERCDYCDTTPKAPDVSLDVERVVELVVEGIQAEYEDPVEQALWDSREGGYQVPTRDTYDLLAEHEIAEDDRLLFDLAAAISNEVWCQKDPYAANETQALQWGWAAFRNYVKTTRRYTFLATDDSTADGAGEIPMYGVPAAVVEAMRSARLLTTFPAGTTWWRARVHAAGEKYSAARDIGTPPGAHARDNRMSPKGIGAFYGADTLDGAHAEVAGYAQAGSELTIGRFTQLADLKIVDLRHLDRPPSLFDSARRHLRAPLAFMRDFVSDVTRVADPSDSQNLEYIPTQVIAEHLRYDLPADGICWWSSRKPHATACVLFLPSNAMADPGAATEAAGLELDPTSLTVVPVVP